MYVYAYIYIYILYTYIHICIYIYINGWQVVVTPWNKEMLGQNPVANRESSLWGPFQSAAVKNQQVTSIKTRKQMGHGFQFAHCSFTAGISAPGASFRPSFSIGIQKNVTDVAFLGASLAAGKHKLQVTQLQQLVFLYSYAHIINILPISHGYPQAIT